MINLYFPPAFIADPLQHSIYSIYSFSFFPLLSPSSLLFLSCTHTNTCTVCFLLAHLGVNHICPLPLAYRYGKWRAVTNKNLISDPVFSSSPPSLPAPSFRHCFILICTSPPHLSLLHPLKVSLGSEQRCRTVNVKAANTKAPHLMRYIRERS